MIIWTDCVNLQGDKIPIAKGPTSNSLRRKSTGQHSFALERLFEQSQYQNLRLSFHFWNDCISHFNLIRILESRVRNEIQSLIN